MMCYMYVFLLLDPVQSGDTHVSFCYVLNV